MQESQLDHFEQEARLKNAPITPQTAESAGLTPSSMSKYSDEKFNGMEEGNSTETFFELMEQKFETMSVSESEFKCSGTNSSSSLKDEKIYYEFTLEVVVKCQSKGTQDQALKVFNKNVVKSIQDEEKSETTMIFDRQHEKLKVQDDAQYIVELLLQTRDGFCKSICSTEWGVPKNAKIWPTCTIEYSTAKVVLNIEILKIGKFYIKPLSAKMPINAVQQFFDYKHKLLNKSDLLNGLEKVSQLKGILYELSQQNMGSRIIQKLLCKASPQQIEMVIVELRDHFREMICDRYGNYVFQKLFKVSNQQQRTLCLEGLHSNLVALLQSKEGTHCLQSIVDNLSLEEVRAHFSIFSEAEILSLSTNKFSTHFIQKITPLMPRHYLHPVLLSNFVLLANNREGVVVLKAAMLSTRKDLEGRYLFLQTCYGCINQIAFTEYGHYIVEEALGYFSFHQVQGILGYIVTYIGYFAENSYASSIARRAIGLYRDYVSVPIIRAVLEGGLVAGLMETAVGEFILHRLIEETGDVGSRGALLSRMMAVCREVRCYEKRQKWLKYFKLG